MIPEIRRPEGVSRQNGLEQAIARYKQSGLFLKLSGNTQVFYNHDLTQFQEEYCQAHNILSPDQLTPEDVTNWRDQLRQGGYSPATINRKRASLSGFLEEAQAKGIIRPDFKKSLPKYESVGKKQPRILSAEQADSLISKAKNLQDASLISIALTTGATTTEIVNLNTEDILGIEDGNTAIRFKGGIRKTQLRILQIDKRIGSEIAEYIEDSGLKPEDPLFKERHKGSRLTRNLVWFMLRDYGREIGVENLNARMLRNTFIAGFPGTEQQLNEVLGRTSFDPATLFSKSFQTM